MKRIIFFAISYFFVVSIFAQNTNLQRIDPPNWWVGMKNDSLQLLVYGKNISSTQVIINSKLVKTIKITKAQSPDYLFIDLKIISKKQGKFNILFKKNNKIIKKYTYQLLKKQHKAKGFDSEDLIYLVFPDRFANGDTSNDSQKNMLEKANRQQAYGRHGGDIQGIINHLDYIKKIGATAIWLNPVMQNNMPKQSYHGYAITDYYKVDSRLGTNILYKKLVNKAHKKGLKVIQDVVYNHCGSNNWWMKDLPFKDWINNNKNYHSNYRGSVLADPHASEFDKKHFSDAWFVDEMPDLNQRNPFLANYLIQNTLWSIETFGIDGLRIDTYAYADQKFLSKLNLRLHEEYPNLGILGEVWLQKLPFVAYFQENSPVSKFNTHLPSVTDFPLYYAIENAFNEQGGWTSGLMRLYYVLAQDFVYSDANKNVIFLDNHDLTRFFSSVGGNINKFKLGLVFLLTTRGIPVVYYGTEIAMNGLKSNGDADLRKDFPGGWQNDSVNIFTQKNMSNTQKEAFNFFIKIANWRKNNDAIKKGKLLQFIPQNNVYVYFRYTEKNAVMIILNNNDKEKRTIDCNRFKEILGRYKSGTEIITNKKIGKLTKIEIAPKSAMIIELK
jgi:glycosidase